MPIPGQPNPGVLSATNTLPKGLKWRPASGGGGIRTVRLPEAASQTFDAFELVSLDSSGNVTNLFAKSDPAANAVTSSASASAAGSPATLVIGMTLTPASNLGSASTTNNIEIIVADDNAEFLIRVYNATGSSAEMQDVLVGDRAELFRYGGASISSTIRDCQTVISDSANATDGINKVVVAEIPADLVAADQYPGVWVKVRSGARSLGI